MYSLEAVRAATTRCTSSYLSRVKRKKRKEERREEKKRKETQEKKKFVGGYSCITLTSSPGTVPHTFSSK